MIHYLSVSNLVQDAVLKKLPYFGFGTGTAGATTGANSREGI